MSLDLQEDDISSAGVLAEFVISYFSRIIWLYGRCRHVLMTLAQALVFKIFVY